MKILIVDDHPLIREGLRLRLSDVDPHVQVIEAKNCADALARVAQHGDLDLVLLDLDLPDAVGFSALTTLRDKFPAIRIVVISASDDDGVIDGVIDKGAKGFLLKTESTDVMTHAIHLVLAGGIYRPVKKRPSNSEALIGTSRQNDHAIMAKIAAYVGLTPREAEVLEGLRQAKPNKIISRELNMSESTVKIHVSSILRRLDVKSRTQVILATDRLRLRFEGPEAKGKN